MCLNSKFIHTYLNNKVNTHKETCFKICLIDTFYKNKAYTIS